MRILIQHNDNIRKFLVLESSDRDGTLTLVATRECVDSSGVSWSTQPGGQEPKQREFDPPLPKSKRVTIHQSGRVNYHENRQRIFIEPLTCTTCVTCIYCYRVPALSALDLFAGPVAKEDVIFDLSEVDDESLSFSIFLGPADHVPPGKAIKLTYDNQRYSIAVSVDRLPFPVPSGYERCFITITPSQGLFLEQQIEEDRALVSYHQAITGSFSQILYQPNGAGVFQLIFSDPMRIAPMFKIELADPELHVIDQDVQREYRSEKVMLKFKVRNRKTGQIIKHPVEIKLMSLDSRFYP